MIYVKLVHAVTSTPSVIVSHSLVLVSAAMAL